STTRSDGRGGFIRDAFPNNMIPSNRISSLSKTISGFFPKPNAPGLVRNFLSTGTEPKKRIENAYVGKFDHSFGTNNRLSVTYTKNGEFFNNSYDGDYANPQNWAGLPFPFASSNGRRYYRGDQYYGN